jgi:predicted nucleic acid binding AN1-type Zn finger protein
MKCACCKKKVQLGLSFTCICGGVHCVTCRLPEVHACPVEEKVAVILPKVVAPKVEKI